MPLGSRRNLLAELMGRHPLRAPSIVKTEGVDAVLLPPKSPNLNAHLERFHRSLKEECLSRLMFFGETALRKAVTLFPERYHTERNHQGLDNRILQPGEEVGRSTGQIKCRERLGGLLRFCYRKAA